MFFSPKAVCDRSRYVLHSEERLGIKLFVVKYFCSYRSLFLKDIRMGKIFNRVRNTSFVRFLYKKLIVSITEINRLFCVFKNEYRKVDSK